MASPASAMIASRLVIMPFPSCTLAPLHLCTSAPLHSAPLHPILLSGFESWPFDQLDAVRAGDDE
jgi:hypothetical protein